MDAVRNIIGADGREVAVRLRPNRSARRMSLRVSDIDGRATLTFPPRIRAREIEAFLEKHRAWLLRSLPEGLDEFAIRPGLCLPIEGRNYVIAASSAVRGPARLTDATLLVPGPAERLTARVEAFLKDRARVVLGEDVGHFAARAGRQAGRLTLRDPRSRWGSCSSRGDLMFSWRLILAPVAVRRYVVAHEVAHLTHMDHSDRFWTHVGELMPDYAVQRKWLRGNGKHLQRYRFVK